MDLRSQGRATQPQSGSNGSMSSSNNTTNHHLVQQWMALLVVMALPLRLPPLVDGAVAEAGRSAAPSAARAATCQRRRISLHAILCLMGAMQFVCLMCRAAAMAAPARAPLPPVLPPRAPPLLSATLPLSSHPPFMGLPPPQPPPHLLLLPLFPCQLHLLLRPHLRPPTPTSCATSCHMPSSLMRS